MRNTSLLRTGADECFCLKAPVVNNKNMERVDFFLFGVLWQKTPR